VDQYKQRFQEQLLQPALARALKAKTPEVGQRNGCSLQSPQQQANSNAERRMRPTHSSKTCRSFMQHGLILAFA
jgi:hypothetical protein